MRTLIAIAILVAAVSAIAQAQVPNVFEDGTAGTAAEVNENFDAIEAALPPSNCATDQIIHWDGSAWVCADYFGLVYMLDTGEAVGAGQSVNAIWIKIVGGRGAYAAIANGKYSNPMPAYFSDPDCRGDVVSRFDPAKALFNSQDGWQYVYSGDSRSDFTSRSYGEYFQSVYVCTAEERVIVDAWPLTQAGGTPTWIVTGQSVSLGLK